MEQKNKISLDDKIINWVSANLFCSFSILVLIIFIILLSVFGITALIYKDKTILNPNEIGDAIGGMTAPIIGLFSAFLVYIAFREQVKANRELMDFNKLTEILGLENIIEKDANSLYLNESCFKKIENDDFILNGKESIICILRFLIERMKKPESLSDKVILSNGNLTNNNFNFYLFRTKNIYYNIYLLLKIIEETSLSNESKLIIFNRIQANYRISLQTPIEIIENYNDSGFLIIKDNLLKCIYQIKETNEFFDKLKSFSN